jgi:hypothetical protein
MTKIAVVCESCNGTGIYRGFMEGPSEAVVCLTCSGSGGIWRQKYTGRKIRKDMARVKIRFRASRSIAILGTSDEAMSYREFKKVVKEIP